MPATSMKVLVTGGSGFVGAEVIKRLLAENFEVSVIINQKSLEFDERLAERCRIYRGDIRDSEILRRFAATEGFDALVHAAGLAHQFEQRREQDFWDINVTGTKNIAELAAKFSVKHFVLISSVAVYGNSSIDDFSKSQNGLDEKAECRPQGVYAVTKYESEKAAREICVRNDIKLIVLRLATVIGENDRGNVFRLIRAIDRRRFVWLGNGHNLKSLIYKGDVARACVEVLKRPDRFGIYNITSEALTMREIVAEIYRCLGRKMLPLSISPLLINVFFRLNRQTLNVKFIEKISEVARKWLADDVFSGKKFKTDFNLQPETTVHDGIKREVESYIQSK